MITLYGIRSCDTIRKARRWLDAHDIEYRFHDLRTDGLDKDLLHAWVRELGWENLLNRRGTTWRRLPEEQRSNLDASRAMDIMLSHPASIKRPVLDLGNSRHLGFDASQYNTLFP